MVFKLEKNVLTLWNMTLLGWSICEKNTGDIMYYLPTYCNKKQNALVTFSIFMIRSSCSILIGAPTWNSV
jgi:hypothetical protein